MQDWLPCPWAVAGPGRATSRRAEPHISDQAPPVWRAPEGLEGLAAVPVGGGGAWPGFETTRRAKLAARTARGRAAAHGHNQQPGPQDSTCGARNTSGATSNTTTRHHTNAPRHTKNRHPDRMSACGGARGIRTPDLLIANETRYQLRHSPKDSNSLAPSQSAMQADHRRVRHDTEPTHATAPRARRPAARHQQLRGPYWARRASRTASRSRATA